MAAPAFGAAGTQLENTLTVIPVDVPDGVVATSIVCVTMFIDGAATVTAMPTGFAQAPDSPVAVNLGGAGQHRLYVMWKRATGADNTASTYDFTLSGSSFVSAQAIRYEGAIATGDPWDVTASAESGTTSVTASPAVSDTTTVVDTLLIHAASNWGGGNPWTPSAGFTERRDLSFGHATVGDKAQAAAGATGSISATSTASNKSGAWLGALKSVAGGGGGIPNHWYEELDACQGPTPAPWCEHLARWSPLPEPPAGGQAAVALTPADGEIISGSTQSNFLANGFYTRKGLTRARDWVGPNPLGGNFAGFDDLDFIPICAWLTDFAGTGFYARMDDLGLNGMWPAAGSVDLDNNVTFGKWAAVEIGEHPAGTITNPQDPHVIGIVTGDEPSTVLGYEANIADAATWLANVSDGPGRMSLLNYADNLLNGDIEGTYDTTDMALGRDAAHPTPAYQWTGCDQYWFAGAPDDSGGSQTKLQFRLYQSAPGAGTEDQTARGSHYGSMMDCIRKAYPPGDVRPFAVWIENGAPYDLASSAAITPAQMKWAVWSTIVHGARQITYFNHTFRTGDPLLSHNNFNDDGYGGPGIAGTGIYAAAKETNLRALQIAHVINSPFDGYFVYGDDGTGAISTAGFLTAVTSTNARARYAGVDASCKWEPSEQKHYILATTRESGSATNIPVTFRMVDQGQTSAVRVFAGGSVAIQRGGAIPEGFCEFSDTFATAADYHVYRID